MTSKKSDLNGFALAILEIAGGDADAAIRMISRRIKLAAVGDRRKSLTVDRLKQRLSYDPETGNFYWLQSFKTKIGQIAGIISTNGYRYIRIDGCDYLAHRLTWFYMTGHWPERLIDHINGDPADNSWANLREASPSDNMANGRWPTRTLADGTVLPRGIFYRHDHPLRPFSAKIKCRGKTIYIGSFGTVDEAVSAHRTKATELFGSFVRDS